MNDVRRCIKLYHAI